MKNALYKAWRSVQKYVIRMYEQIDSNHLFVHTASISYYILFSLSPFVILLVAIIPFTPLTKESLILGLSRILPASLATFGQSLINEMYNLSGVILPISLAIILWSASLGVKSIRDALTEIYHFYDHKSVVKRYALSMFFTLVFIVLMMVIIIFGILGQPIYELLDGILPELPQTISSILQFNNIFTILATFIVTTLCYIFLPPGRNKFREQWVGIVFTVIVQFIFSKLFSIYITLVNGYSVYGSLAIIAVLLFYVYWAIFILLLGAQINADIKTQKDLRNEELF